MDEMLQISPLELKFKFELRKQIPTSLRLHNPTNNHVAFKVKTTSPKKYCVRPNTGTMPPHTTTEVAVIMQMQKDAPANPSQCKDKFLVQSLSIGPDALPDTPTPEFLADLFAKEKANGAQISETKLKVSYIMSNNPPSPVPEDREAEVEELSPIALMATEKPPVPYIASSTPNDAKYETAMASLAHATNERNAATQETVRLRKELDKMMGQVKELESKPALLMAKAGTPAVVKPVAKASKVAGLVAGFRLIHLLITAILAFLLGRYT